MPLLSVVEHDQDAPSVRCLEGDVGERRQRVGRNTHRAWPHEFGRVRDDVVGRIARDVVAVDGDGAEAPVASAPVRVRFPT